MTPREQRRLEQKLARKAAKRALKAEVVRTVTAAEPASLAGASTPDTSSTSAAKLSANRSNAQLSTGPVTAEGKAVVSQNATQHGLTGKFKVLASESQAEFDQLLAAFMNSEAPAGEDEIEMVHQMAEALWLSRRSVRLQNDCFAVLECGTATSAKGADARHQTGDECLERSGGAPEAASVLRARSAQQRAAHKMLALYLRYQTAHDRTFARYSTELRKRRNERARAERGFVSQKHKQAAEHRRQELHAARQALQNLKQESQQVRNRIAAAKAEALELKNLAKKSNTLAAAA